MITFNETHITEKKIFFLHWHNIPNNDACHLEGLPLAAFSKPSSYFYMKWTNSKPENNFKCFSSLLNSFYVDVCRNNCFNFCINFFIDLRKDLILWPWTVVLSIRCCTDQSSSGYSVVNCWVTLPHSRQIYRTKIYQIRICFE